MGRRCRSAARALPSLGVALLGLAACGPDSAQVAPSGTAPSAVPITDPTTVRPPSPTGRASVPAGASRIEIAVNDCEGCIVTAYVPLVKGQDLKTWASEPVRGGRTSLLVPTASTHAMSFDVQGTPTLRLSFRNARPAVVLAYRTPRGGTQQGNWCWAGTSASVVALTIHHSRLPAARFGGGGLPGEDHDDHEDVFEARPALPVVAGEWQPSPEGGLGHQDAPYCQG